MTLSADQKTLFDKINQHSYLFRLQMERAGFSVSLKQFNGCDAYFIIYRNHVIGVVSFGDEYVNFSIYTYLKKMFPKLEDFRMADYFAPDMSRFLFEKFDEYAATLKASLDTLPEEKSVTDIPETIESIDDVKARLLNFLVADDAADMMLGDDSIVMSVLRHDISMILAEVERLNQAAEKRNDALMRLFKRL